MRIGVVLSLSRDIRSTELAFLAIAKLTAAAVLEASTDVGAPLACVLRLSAAATSGRLIDNDHLLLLLLRLLVGHRDCSVSATFYALQQPVGPII